jgi:simple sugar transport system permease protein
VLQGFVFIAILMSDALYGRLKMFAPERWGR